MADPKVKARIEADDRASKVVEKVEGRFKRFGNFLASRFVISLGDVTRLVRSLGRAFTSTIEAATAQEDAINKLKVALDSVNDATPDTILDFQKFASEMQKITTVGDETILAMSALALSFTGSAEQAKKLTEVALDFASGAGISFEESVRRLGRSLGGATGDIANFAPEIRNLTAEEVKAGVQLDILGKKFAGFAANEAKTFSGMLKQLGNAFGDLQEKAGESVTSNEKAAAAIKRITEVLQDEKTADRVGDLAARFVDLAAGAVELAAAAPEAEEGFRNFFAGIGKGIPVLEVVNAAIDNKLRKSLKDVNTDMPVFLAGFSSWVDQMQETGEESRKTATALDEFNKETEKSVTHAERLAAALKDDAEEFETMSDLAKELGVSLESEVTDKLEANVAKLKDVESAAAAGIITWRDYDRIVAAVDETNDELRESLSGVTDETGRAIDAKEKMTEATQNLTAATKEQNTELKQEEEQIRMTTAAYDALLKSKGKQVAVAAALESGATLTQSGTRLRFGSTGSRLVRDSRWQDSSWVAQSGSFAPIHGSRVLPNGQIEFY